MFITLGRLVFKKNIILNIIVIIQLGIALIISIILIGTYNKMYQAYNYTYNYSEDTVFFSPMKINGSPVINVDFEYLQLNNISMEFLSKKFDGKTADILCYDEKTFNGLKKQLKSGVWASSLISNGMIECVAIDDIFSIGDTFSEQIKENIFTFIVVGKLAKNSLVISSSRSSYLMQADMLFYEYSSIGKAVICSNSSIAEATGNYGNALIFFNNADENIKNKTIENLRNSGNAITMETIRENTDNELVLTVKGFLPLAICFAIMGLIAIIGMSLLNILKNSDVFSAYFICGMNRKNAFLLNLGYMIWMIFGIIIATLILFILCSVFDIINKLNYLPGVNQICFSVLFLTLITLIATSISFAFLKRENISKS